MKHACLIPTIFFLFVGPTWAQPDTGNSETGAPKHPQYVSQKVGLADQKRAAAAAEGGMAEVKFAQLALSNGHNAQVKSFAQKMVKDHSAANDELKTIANKNGIHLPGGLNAAHQTAYNKLSHLKGASFDSAYVTSQINDHEDANRVFTEGASSSTNRDLKNFFAKHQAHIKMHLDLARQLPK